LPEVGADAIRMPYAARLGVLPDCAGERSVATSGGGLPGSELTSAVPIEPLKDAPRVSGAPAAMCRRPGQGMAAPAVLRRAGMERDRSGDDRRGGERMVFRGTCGSTADNTGDRAAGG
jgi:hypothetical protein